MHYSRFDPSRYASDPIKAREIGDLDFLSISSMIGSDTNQTILEIGCGSGNLLLALRERGFINAVGLERDRALTEHGKTVLGVEIHTGTWPDDLSMFHETFDVIVILDVIEHLPREQLETALEIARRKLRPGGRLILRGPNAQCPWALPMLFSDLDHKLLLVPRTLEFLLKEAGFNGPISIKETRPSSFLKRILFSLLHNLAVKPMVSLTHYYFHGQFASHITPNIVCCAEVATKSEDECQLL